jgi:hypothetical protein
MKYIICNSKRQSFICFIAVVFTVITVWGGGSITAVGKGGFETKNTQEAPDEIRSEA